MKTSINWLKELVDLKLSPEKLADQLSLNSIGVKEQTEDYLEIDLTYNRGDLLSLRGVAYEVAAITGSKVRFEEPREADYVWVEKQLDGVDIRTVEEEAPVYCLAKIEGLKVEKSPEEWIKKLECSGMRSVNNLADITNLVMLEYGQPLHAFDAKDFGGVSVKLTLVPGEHFTAIDNKQYVLEKDDIVIYSYNHKKTVALAGIIGGKDTEVTESTNAILLEAAIFDPVSIRKTAQRLGLQSEASKRFVHGLTAKRLFQALDAAIRMYQDLGGKLTALTIVGESEDQLKKVPLTLSKVNSLIGVEITGKQVVEFLQKLHFEVSSVDDNSWVVTPPYWRLDIEIEEDLIEEVARMYGYEKIPPRELSGNLPEKIDQSLFDLIYNLKKTLADAGLTEVQTYSFSSSQVLKTLGINDDNRDALVRIANPISSETEYMREFIWPNLVEVVAKNIRQGYKDIAIFEIGKVYMPKPGELPKESYRLAITLMNGSDNPLQEVVSIFQAVIQSPAGPGVESVSIEQGGLMKELETLFHPKRFVTIKKGDKTLGGAAEVHPRFLNNFGIDKRVAILEIAIEPLL